MGGINSVRSGFALTLGLVTVPVNLYSVAPSDTGRKMKTLCAEHKAPMKQAWRCSKGSELDPETVKGFEETKDVYRIPDNEYEAIPKDAGIDLVAVPKADVDRYTVEGSAMYYLRPTTQGLMAWEIMFRLAQTKDRTMIAQTAVRDGSKKIYKLDVFKDCLVMREIVFPGVLREPTGEVEHPKVPKQMMDLAKQALDAATVSWEDFDSSDENQRRFDEFVSTGEVTKATDGGDTTNASGPQDLMEALRRSVEETKRRTK